MSNVLSKSGSANPVFIPWKEHYALGNYELDMRRKRFLSVVNDLHACLEVKHEDKVKAVLDQLVQCSKSLFRREEELLERHGFPDLANHSILHVRFVQDTVQLSRLFPGAVTGPELLRFLRRWWVNHMHETDKKHAPYLHDKVLLPAAIVAPRR